MSSAVAVEHPGFGIHRISDALGADVIGLDVSRALDTQSLEVIKDAFQMKDRLEPLHMVRYYEFGRRLFEELPPLRQAEKSLVPPVTHPVVRMHLDRSNRRSLFFTTNAGNEIGGMSLEDGQALHRKLASHVSQPRLCYKHRWRVNDLVMWDNRRLLHRAKGYDMDRYRRVFRRTTVAGNGPIRGPYSRH